MSVITADYTHKSFIIKTSSPQTELNSNPDNNDMPHDVTINNKQTREQGIVNISLLMTAR